MIPVYRGFDGLEVSFRAQVPQAFCCELEQAQDWAKMHQCEVPLTYGGISMLVAESGARGGYAFRVSTGALGATWFFKRPTPNQPWGVRVSCNSFMLAERGLGGARADLYGVMDALGIEVPQGAESIGRIDYAIDFLAPELVLVPEQFVMHSNASRQDHLEQSEVRVSGKSGRVTSVTVGKMPGRQVIVYDKRAEIIAKQKLAWVDVWNASLAHQRLPELDITDPASSRVWRVELRAGKRQLKERWQITTWGQLHDRLGDLVTEMIEAIRYTEPCRDTNRSRWPDGHLWQAVRSEVDEDLFELRNFAPPETIRRVNKDTHLRLLSRQCLGLLISCAALEEVAFDDLPAFFQAQQTELIREVKDNPRRFEARLREAKARYEVVF